MALRASSSIGGATPAAPTGEAEQVGLTRSSTLKRKLGRRQQGAASLVDRALAKLIADRQ